MHNPYIAGNPIHNPVVFYDRTNLLQLLLNPDASAHYVKGNRRTGKTSLLYQIYYGLNGNGIRLKNNVQSLAIFYDLQGLSDEREFIHYLGTECKRAAQQKNYTLPELPNDSIVSAINNLVAWAAEINCRVFLLVDEAEGLLKLPANIRQQLHRIFINQHDNLTVILAATNDLQQLHHADRDQVAFLDGFQIHHVPHFAVEDAAALVRQLKLKEEERPVVTDALVADIIHNCGGHPFYLQRLCMRLFDNGQLRQIAAADILLDIQLRHYIGLDFTHLEKLEQEALLHFHWEQPTAVANLPNRYRNSVAELHNLGFLRATDDNRFSISNIFLHQWLTEYRANPNPTSAPASVTPAPAPVAKPLRVFISYAHADEPFKDALHTHLAILRRSNAIATWTDRAILPGQEWDDSIKQQLAEAEFILLLVSAAFMASDYIWKHELTKAMERHDAKTAVVIPVFIKECDWKGAPFGKIQGLPPDAKPIGQPDNDGAWTRVAQGIRNSVDAFRAR